MPRVRVEPGRIDLVVAEGETIIEAAWRAGYYWPTICQGVGRCAQCYVIIEAGVESFDPPNERESQILEWAVRFSSESVEPDPIRLACQSRLHGDAVVRRPGVRPAGDGSG